MIDEVALPEGCYISALVRQGSVLMAHHDVIIESGDHLIVFMFRAAVRSTKSKSCLKSGWVL